MQASRPASTYLRDCEHRLGHSHKSDGMHRCWSPPRLAKKTRESTLRKHKWLHITVRLHRHAHHASPGLGGVHCSHDKRQPVCLSVSCVFHSFSDRLSQPEYLWMLAASSSGICRHATTPVVLYLGNHQIESCRILTCHRAHTYLASSHPIGATSRLPFRLALPV